MSNFKLGSGSCRNLEDVHHDLARVARRAIQITPYDFGVVCGLRTQTEQQDLADAGATTTLKSLHLRQHDGKSHAIDIAVYVNGVNAYKLYNSGRINEAQLHGYFRKVIQAFFTAAIELGVQIEAGGLWRTFIDSPHVQLAKDPYRVDTDMR